MEHSHGGSPTPGEVTRLLGRVESGDREAIDRLFPLVYAELRRLARAHVSRNVAPSTLSATGLVHEAYLKFAGGGSLRAESRAHFMAIAGRAMRQVMIDRARMRGAKKRGGAALPVTLMEGHSVFEMDPVGMLALDAALSQLDERQRLVVDMRFFAGMEEREIAAALGVSERTVRREWVKARAWLVRALSAGDGAPSEGASPAPDNAAPGASESG